MVNPAVGASKLFNGNYIFLLKVDFSTVLQIKAEKKKEMITFGLRSRSRRLWYIYTMQNTVLPVGNWGKFKTGG